MRELRKRRRGAGRSRWPDTSQTCSLDDHTRIPVLLLAYLFVGVGVGVGVGIGFANAPITNTAVSGLPAAQAGVASAITSTARQVGVALGVAVAGGIIADTAPANLAQASRRAWLIVAACGLLLLLVVRVSPAAGQRN